MIPSTFEPVQPARLIVQGEFAVGGRGSGVIRTLLGSCVSCCLWDDLAAVGGMNHLLLAGYRINGASYNNLVGVTEMERLINEILKLGGTKSNLKAKVFGGSEMLTGRTGIGEMNARFVEDFLQQERIPCINKSVGGGQARIVKFWPESGRVSMRLTQQSAALDERPVAPVETASSLELF